VILNNLLSEVSGSFSIFFGQNTLLQKYARLTFDPLSYNHLYPFSVFSIYLHSIALVKYFLALSVFNSSGSNIVSSLLSLTGLGNSWMYSFFRSILLIYSFIHLSNLILALHLLLYNRYPFSTVSNG
jgi:hypothetical protein